MAALPNPSLTSAMTDSVRKFDQRAHPRITLLQVASIADEAPLWPSLYRDQYLEEFWPKEPFLAGAIFSVCSRNAAFRWELTGPRKQVQWAQRLLSQADFGQGWQSLIMKLSQDILTTGNGAFLEIIRPARARTKQGRWHDAVRTLNPETHRPEWFVYDRLSGKIDWGMKQGADFEVTDSPVDLPVGLGQLDSMRCLGRDTRVRLADGTTKSILSMVKNEHPGPVMALGENGNIVSRRVTGWHATDLGNRKWVRVVLTHARHTFGRPEGIWSTDDHQILTPSGWKQAGELKIGDAVVTEHAAPSQRQCEFMVGSMLGDAHMRIAGSSGRMSFIHCKRQREWLALKRMVMSGFSRNNIRESANGFFRFEIRGTPAFNKWVDDWYPNGKKIVQREYIEKYFGDLMLAAWYMDDGNIQRGKWGRPKVRLYTNSFEKHDVEWLADFLTQKGIKSHCRRARKDRSYYYIYVTADGAEELFRRVGRLIHPCMRYKLPHWADSFCVDEWLSDAERFVDTIRSVEYGDNGAQRTAYCLDVEQDHNFLAAGLVVHNCERTGDPAYPVVYTDINGVKHTLASHQVVPLSEMPSPREDHYNMQHCAIDRSLRVAQIMRDMEVYKHEKVSGRFARAVHLTNIDAEVIQDAITQANENNDNKGLIRYSQPIIAATLDPNARASTETIELASMPDGFNEDDTLRWYVAALALGFGVDYGFLAPLPGNKLGTGTQAETADRQARGKSSRLFINLMEHAINWHGILPCDTVFKFNTPDPFEESERDRALGRRARSLSILVKANIITPEIAAQIASDDGDISPQYLAQMGLADLTPIITVSSDDVICDVSEFVPRVPPQIPQELPPQDQPPPGDGGEGE